MSAVYVLGGVMAMLCSGPTSFKIPDMPPCGVSATWVACAIWSTVQRLRLLEWGNNCAVPDHLNLLAKLYSRIWKREGSEDDEGAPSVAAILYIPRFSQRIRQDFE